jgi:hypothetical protein
MAGNTGPLPGNTGLKAGNTGPSGKRKIPMTARRRAAALQPDLQPPDVVCYLGRQLPSGPIRRAAGRINPPRRNRRGYTAGFAPLRVIRGSKIPSFFRVPYNRTSSLLTSAATSDDMVEPGAALRCTQGLELVETARLRPYFNLRPSAKSAEMPRCPTIPRAVTVAATCPDSRPFAFIRG